MYSLYLKRKEVLLIAQEEDIESIKREILKQNSFHNIAITGIDEFKNAITIQEINNNIDLAKVIETE